MSNDDGNQPVGLSIPRSISHDPRGTSPVFPGPDIVAEEKLRDILETHRNNYWDIVKETLKILVPNKDRRSDCYERLDVLRSKIDNQNELDIGFFHASPLEVAADLAGRGRSDGHPRELTFSESELEQYGKLASTFLRKTARDGDLGGGGDRVWDVPHDRPEGFVRPPSR